jgi:hypothetical protein
MLANLKCPQYKNETRLTDDAVRVIRNTERTRGIFAHTPAALRLASKDTELL